MGKANLKTITVSITAGAKSCRDDKGDLCKLCVDMMPFAYRPDYECLAYEVKGKGIVLKDGKDGHPLRCAKCLKAEVSP